MEKIGTGQENEFGVLSHRIENNHYIVSIRWRDGVETDKHFPVSGFPVVDPKTDKSLGHINGNKALKILEKNSAEMTADEFSWLDFVR